VETGLLFSHPAHWNHAPDRSTQAVPPDQRDAQCPSAKRQKLKAICIIPEDLRGVLMTKNDQFLSSNEKTAGRLFVIIQKIVSLCPAPPSYVHPISARRLFARLAPAHRPLRI
jgi:hypothetical protein